MSLSLSSKGAAAERKLSTLAVFSEAPDGAERRGGGLLQCVAFIPGSTLQLSSPELCHLSMNSPHFWDNSSVLPNFARQQQWHFSGSLVL